MSTNTAEALGTAARRSARVLWRAVRALVRAASAKQLAVVALVVFGAVMVLLDLATNDGSAEHHGRPESATTQPAAEAPPAAEPADEVTADEVPAAGPQHRSLLALVFGTPAAVRFLGFTALSLALLCGVLVLFWWTARRSDP